MPFEFGRPLGAVDAAFQKRVLIAALRLFEAQSGPVLEDFPEDAPFASSEIIALSCPVNFKQETGNLTQAEQLCVAFKSEMGAMRPWYDIAIRKRGRTTVGVSRLELETIPDFICLFLEGKTPQNPREDIDLANMLKFVIDDLKAFYFEGITAQPGQEFASGQVLSDWFWGDTMAAKVLLTVKEICKKSENRLMQIVGNVLIVPSEVARHKAI